MTRIRINKKRNNKLLPWTLGLLAVALLVVWFDDSMSVEPESLATLEEPTVVYEVANAGPVRGEPIYSAEVASFLRLTERINSGPMDIDHEFSHRAFSVLAKAALAVARDAQMETDTYVVEAAAEVRAMADDITRYPEATNHADKLRRSAALITAVFDRVNQYNEEVTTEQYQKNLSLTANGIDPSILTLDQTDEIKNFLLAARLLLLEIYR